MKFKHQWTVRRRWVFGTAILFLALAPWVGLKNSPRVQNFGSHRRDQKVRPSVPHAPASIEFSDRLEVRRYFMDFDGDHSLDVATVTEQPLGGYARYTVHLDLASGVEQSIVLTAPPGGLQLEMHDMTGDKVPNDLILRPALLRWLPTVLLNDGHDHFDVAISGPGPGSISSDQELASTGSDNQGTVALLSSGFKAGSLVKDGGLFLQQVQQDFLSPTTQTVPQSLGYSSSSGRAPPALVITA